MTDPAPPPPPTALVRSPLSDGEWHRLHPLTPLMRGGLALIVVVGVIVANLRDRLIAIFLPGIAGSDDFQDWERSRDPIDFVIANNLYLVAILVVLGVILLLIAAFALSWRFHTFRITGDDVEVRSGILFRTQRRAPLDRVQGVNLTRPMVARLLGMAKLEVVGAGTDGNVKLEYLSTANAEAVRADILRLASGQRLADAGPATPASPASRAAALGQTVSRGFTGLVEGDDSASEAPESVVHIPYGRLIASQILTPGTFGLLVAIAAIIVGATVGTPWVLFGFVPAVLGYGVYWVRKIVRSLRYSMAPTGDGVRITFGLLTTVTEIVPPGRVHAVEVTQSILWRGLGWWTVRMNRLTGRSASDNNTDQFTTVLPVGTLADVERVLYLLLPDIDRADWPTIVGQGVSGPRVAEPVPSSADESAPSDDSGDEPAEGDVPASAPAPAVDPFTTTPRRARILRPLSWRRNGHLLTRDLLLLRRGAIWRGLVILPLARLQSIALHQGPLSRALGVASVRGNVIAGPVYASLGAVDRDVALALFADTAEATVLASQADRSHRWAGAQDAVTPADEMPSEAVPEALSEAVPDESAPFDMPVEHGTDDEGTSRS